MHLEIESEKKTPYLSMFLKKPVPIFQKKKKKTLNFFHYLLTKCFFLTIRNFNTAF